ncbi:hypothetical protein ACKFKF_15635 [Phormidesmis sp. 146-12]
MGIKVLPAIFLFLAWNYLPAQAQTCKDGDSQSINYILRKNDPRCEGLKPFNVGGDFTLVSFAVGKINPSGGVLTLQVPNQGTTQKPFVRVISFRKNYQLDPISLQESGSWFKFNWSNFVLEQAKISLNSLRALASSQLGSQTVYLPVRLGQSSGKYDFVIYSGRRVRILKFQISSKGSVTYSTSRPVFQPAGEQGFAWDGRNTPKGRYELRVNAEMEQGDRSPEPVSINVAFEHDPQWLK